MDSRLNASERLIMRPAPCGAEQFQSGLPFPVHISEPSEQIPLVQGIRESGDAGEPVALSSRPDGEAFVLLAGKLAEAVREG